MKILSLDQSTQKTGFAITIDGNYAKSGVIELKNKDTIQRLLDMTEKIIALVNSEDPDIVVFEDVHYSRGMVHGLILLARLQGMLMLRLSNLDKGWAIVAPTVWKSCCGIKGRDRKTQKCNTIAFVQDTYGCLVDEDQADAIGIATWAIKNLEKKKETNNESQ